MTAAVTQCQKGEHLLGLEKDAARFSKHVSIQPDGCHIWAGAKAGRGYGVFMVGSRTDGSRRMVYAHRWAYVHRFGAIPEGLTIDHLCNTPACVNPAHLSPATQYDNSMRGNSAAAVNKRKTHCPAGHEYDQKNTYVDATGARHCRACGRISAYNRWLKKKGRAA